MADLHEDNPESVWKIVKKVRTAMFITRKGDDLETRPLQAIPEEEAGRILFMTDSKDIISEVGANSRVLLSFADEGGNNYAAIDGQAAVENDRAKIKELWNPAAKAYWDGPDDPSIRIIAVTPQHARYWDAPGKLVTSIAMLAGAVTGKPPGVGKAGDVRLN